MLKQFKDKILLFQLKTGDPDAFARLYDMYVNNIYRFIYFKVTNREEAEDLTSDVFLRVWRYIRDGSAPDNIKAFLYRVARNAVIDFYRREHKHRHVNIEEVTIIDKETHLNLIKDIDNQKEFSNVTKALASLKEEYQEVLTLKYVDGYSTVEIAEILERNQGAVRVLAHRALEALKKKL